MQFTQSSGDASMWYETRDMASILATVCDGGGVLWFVGGLQRSRIQGGSHVATH